MRQHMLYVQQFLLGKGGDGIEFSTRQLVDLGEKIVQKSFLFKRGQVARKNAAFPVCYVDVLLGA